MLADLREFIEKCEQEGELKKIEGADWDLELGVLTEIEATGPNPTEISGPCQAGSHVGAYMLKYVVIVDDDIDPSNIKEVLWALGSRTDPEVSLDVIRGCWGSQTDPYVSPQKSAIQDYTHGIAIILACKPYHYIKDFPPTIRTSPELLKKVKDKWGKI